MSFELSEKALELHQQMGRTKSSGSLFTQAELEKLVDCKTPQHLAEVIQELINHKYVKLVKQGSTLLFQSVSSDEAAKVKNMTKDEALVYTYVEASGREGIWTKTLKMKTNLHQHVVLRCLKSLESQQYIKCIKSVKHPTRKIYMLWNLQPSVEVTGGPWFTDSELDVDFIDTLLTVVWRYVAMKSYPKAFGGTDNAQVDRLEPTDIHPSLLQQNFPANYGGYPTVENIQSFVMESKITPVDLAVGDIRSLCEVLVYDERLERLESGHMYKATWNSVLAMGGGGALGNAALLYPKLPEEERALVSSIFGGTHEEVNEEDPVFLDTWLEI